MGLPFTISLQHLIERVAVPLHEIFAQAQPRINRGHELLWDCYASGQMSDAELHQEVSADPEFGVFVKNRQAEYH
jgi:hypothetical protein